MDSIDSLSILKGKMDSILEEFRRLDEKAKVKNGSTEFIQEKWEKFLIEIKKQRGRFQSNHNGNVTDRNLSTEAENMAEQYKLHLYEDIKSSYGPLYWFGPKDLKSHIYKQPMSEERLKVILEILEIKGDVLKKTTSIENNPRSIIKFSRKGLMLRKEITLEETDQQLSQGVRAKVIRSRTIEKHILRRASMENHDNSIEISFTSSFFEEYLKSKDEES